MSIEAGTELPHIVVSGGEGGEPPIIRGTGLSVALIAALFNRGETPERMLLLFPNLANKTAHRVSPGGLFRSQ